MGRFVCSFPATSTPRELLDKLDALIKPMILTCPGKEVYSHGINKLEWELEKMGKDQDQFAPLVSLRRLASHNAPHWEIVINHNDQIIATGSINQNRLSVSWNLDSPRGLLIKLMHFVQLVPGAIFRVEDDNGDEIPTEATQ